MFTEIAKLVTTLFALLCILILELYAMKLGIDGALLAAVIAVIAGIAGYSVKPIIQMFKTKTPPE